jgi:hypothetical protein
MMIPAIAPTTPHTRFHTRPSRSTIPCTICMTPSSTHQNPSVQATAATDAPGRTIRKRPTSSARIARITSRIRSPVGTPGAETPRTSSPTAQITK